MFEATFGIDANQNGIDQNLVDEIGKVAAIYARKADRCLEIGDDELAHFHLYTAGAAARLANRPAAPAAGAVPKRNFGNMFANEAFENGWLDADPIAQQIVAQSGIDLAVLREFSSARGDEKELHQQLSKARDAYKQLRCLPSLDEYRKKAREISQREQISYSAAAERVMPADAMMKNDVARSAIELTRSHCRAARALISTRRAGSRPPRNGASAPGRDGLLSDLMNVEELSQRLSWQSQCQQPIFDELTQLLESLQSVKKHFESADILPRDELRELARLALASNEDAQKHFENTNVIQAATDLTRDLADTILALLRGLINGVQSTVEESDARPAAARPALRPR
ncbi:hypothetical protein ABWL39_09110 [Chitinivorax sp. PXF-14]|uniref:hypothetical protein n=1 Tax=Chitinivorax sp. PXF-14 TaxID=3230488 RepID=UPI003466CE98